MLPNTAAVIQDAMRVAEDIPKINAQEKRQPETIKTSDNVPTVRSTTMQGMVDATL